MKIGASTLHFLPDFLIHLHFVHLEKLKNVYLLATTFVKIHKTNHVNSKVGQKCGSRSALNNVFNP